MTNKLVVLKLTSLRYSGQSIGDNLTIEAEIAGKSISVNKKLVPGQIASLNVEVGQFITNQSSFSLSGVIRVIERDPVFNDVGEGPYRGRTASVKRKSDGSSHLSDGNPQSGPVKLVYSISRKTLRVRGKSWQTKDYPSTPWTAGFYDVEIPDAPHKGGLNYPDVTRAKTWFRIGHQGDRYIHTGRNSLGCITVTEHDRWDELYTILVRARKDDGRSIGTLQVVE